MNNTKFYKGFSEKSLEKLPVNFQLLTEITSPTKIKTSSSEDYQGIRVHQYNTIIENNSKHYSPISKIIDFE